jgi:TetR/AcrR family transcriptional regulator, mexJK operon transcriptional repressor
MITRTVRQEAKRDQIRAAARDLFLRQGFAETSMDAVTAAAGVSKQTLYRYYETKAELFADVLTGLVVDATPSAPKSAPPKPPRSMGELEAALLAVSQDYLARLMQPQQLALLRVVIAEGSRVPELTEAFRSTVPAADAAAVIAILEGGRASGLVPESVDSRTAARALASLLLALVFRDGLLAPRPRPPDRRQLVEMIRLLVSGIAARPGEMDR